MGRFRLVPWTLLLVAAALGQPDPLAKDAEGAATGTALALGTDPMASFLQETETYQSPRNWGHYMCGGEQAMQVTVDVQRTACAWWWELWCPCRMRWVCGG